MNAPGEVIPLAHYEMQRPFGANVRTSRSILPQAAARFTCSPNPDRSDRERVIGRCEEIIILALAIDPMQIRFRCRHCKKSLAVKQELAGKKAKCPVCKQPIVIPAPVTEPADVEDLAMQALADEPAQQEAAPKSIDFECEYCGEVVSMALDMAGKREPCPSCKRIVRVPVPEGKQEDWRKLKQTGPSLAVNNQQEKLEGEWGTETARTRVSRDAMEEADAFVVPDEPVSIGKWVKRGVIAVVLVCAIVAAGFSFNRQQRLADQKGSLETVLALLKEAPKNSDPKLQLPTDWVAEIQRGLGEYYVRKTGKGMLDKARSGFNEAWGAFADVNRLTKPSIDRDLFLLRVAESQVALGGSEDEEKEKAKVAWMNMPEKLSPALRKMQSDDARAKGLRLIAAKLKAARQEATTITLITQLSMAGNPKEQARSPVFAQLIAAFIEQNKEDLAAKRLPPPKLADGIADLAPRLGYGEGIARQGQYKQAEDYVRSPGNDSLHQLRTALAIAEVALIANAAAEAKPMLAEAEKIAEARQWIAPDWDLLQLADLMAQSGDIARSEEIAKKLSQGQSWAEYAQFRARLKDLKGGKANADMAQQIKNPNSLPRVLAWEDISRHNTRLGFRDAMKQTLDYPDDPRIKAFIHLGFALGEQDREQ